MILTLKLTLNDTSTKQLKIFYYYHINNKILMIKYSVMDTILWSITILAILLMMMDRVDTYRNAKGKEHFEVYHPKEYERQPLFPYYDTKLDFNCVRTPQEQSISNNHANVCKSQTTMSNCVDPEHTYVLAKSLGRTRQLRMLY